MGIFLSNITFKNTILGDTASLFFPFLFRFVRSYRLSGIARFTRNYHRPQTFEELTFAPHVLVFSNFADFARRIKTTQKWVSPTYGTRIQDATAKDPVTGKSNSFHIISYTPRTTYIL